MSVWGSASLAGEKTRGQPLIPTGGIEVGVGEEIQSPRATNARAAGHPALDTGASYWEGELSFTSFHSFSRLPITTVT